MKNEKTIGKYGYIDSLIQRGTTLLGSNKTLDDFKSSDFPESLKKLLAVKNGFYVFGTSLLVRASGTSTTPLSVEEWNDTKTWKHLFETPPEGICFAENIFGEQYCLYKDEVYVFDPEDSSFKQYAKSLDDWAEGMYYDLDFRTGSNLANQWESEHHEILQAGEKLIPKQAFVLGGHYNISNLVKTDEIQSMKIRAGFANKIKDIPDGTSIEFDFK